MTIQFIEVDVTEDVEPLEPPKVFYYDGIPIGEAQGDGGWYFGPFDNESFLYITENLSVSEVYSPAQWADFLATNTISGFHFDFWSETYIGSDLATYEVPASDATPGGFEEFYSPIFWRPVVVGVVIYAHGDNTYTADTSETALVPLSNIGTSLEVPTANPAVGSIYFLDQNEVSDTGLPVAPTVSWSSSSSNAVNSNGQNVSLTSAQLATLSVAFHASIDPNLSQANWSWSFSTYAPTSKYEDPLAGYNFKLTENVQISETGGSDQSTVTLNITGAPSVTELAELSANAYLVKYYAVPRFQLYDGETLQDGFSATAYLSADGTQMVVAFRGTDFDGNAKNKNLLADASFANGSPNAQFTNYVNDAVAFVKSVTREATAEGDAANVTLTGHSLGGGIAEFIGQSLGLTAIGFDAVGAGKFSPTSFASLQGQAKLGSSTDFENYRLQGDQISLLGEPIGQQYTIENPANFVNPYSAVNLVYHDKLTLANQLLANVKPEAQDVLADPSFFNGLAGYAALLPSLIITSISRKIFGFNYASSALVYLDPSVGYLFNYEQTTASPNLSSIMLPNLSGVSNYIVQEKSGGIWSATQTLAPEVTLTLAANTSGVRFEPLDSNGNVIEADEAFFFAAGFQSSGQVSAKLTEQSEVADDFISYGTSDVLLQNNSGILADWIVQNGAATSANVIGNPGGFSVVHGVDPIHETLAGNFNGDATGDVLLQDSGGNLVDWMTKNGTLMAGGAVGNPSSFGYSVIGTGDFNGDGTTDILLQNAAGNLADWIVKNGTGSSANVIGNPTSFGYHAIATGDFNGDGTTDILLVNDSGNLADWVMQDGVATGSNVIGNPTPYGFSLIGTGDFNGEGTTDLLLGNSNGTIGDWIMQNGQAVSANVIGNPASFGYNVVGTGDYNGDGTSDILLQNAAGNLANWTINNGVGSGSATIGNPAPFGFHLA
jgi:hypothetical protein